jgi:hypothetical protein
MSTPAVLLSMGRKTSAPELVLCRLRRSTSARISPTWCGSASTRWDDGFRRSREETDRAFGTRHQVNGKPRRPVVYLRGLKST